MGAVIEKRRVCECCGQTLQDVREGIKLTPFKARIFDLIKNRPGITKKELCGLLYETVSNARVLTTGAHVQQIREKFEATDLDIRAVPYSGYRITKRKVHVV
jgi:hypothetical protein